MLELNVFMGRTVIVAIVGRAGGGGSGSGSGLGGKNCSYSDKNWASTIYIKNQQSRCAKVQPGAKKGKVPRHDHALGKTEQPKRSKGKKQPGTKSLTWCYVTHETM
jgi:hypothetical protein